MIRKKYKHIFFDLDNTLWDFKQNSYHALKLTVDNYGIANIDFDHFFEIYSKHNGLLWNHYRNKLVAKKELVTKRFSNTFTELGINNVDPEEMNEYYLNAMPDQNLLINGALEILDYLKKKNYLLYIITNGFQEVQHKKLINSGIINFFEKIYISEIIKIPKPASEVFEYAVKSSNAKKTQSIMVGDDWDVDVLGALRFGMDAVYFCPDKKEMDQTDFPRNQLYTIGQLAGLKEVLQ